MIEKYFYKIMVLPAMVFLLGYCASAEKKESSSSGSDVKSTEIFDKYAKTIEKFFESEPVEEEAFRVYVSSDNYSLKQTGFPDSISIVSDTSGRNPMGEELKAYDMVEVFTEAVYKVELFKESGLISRIRPVKPSHISEINKIIADDITRFKFKFKTADKMEPLTFKIRYGVQLQKKKSKEEIKKILQENVRE